MITLAKANAKKRNLDQEIHFEQKDFKKSDFFAFSSENFWILTNPPYGKRISASDLPALYQKLQKSF